MEAKIKNSMATFFRIIEILKGRGMDSGVLTDLAARMRGTDFMEFDPGSTAHHHEEGPYRISGNLILTENVRIDMNSYCGSLHIDGNLYLNRLLLVAGDLIVSGIVELGPWGQIISSGILRAKGIFETYAPFSMPVILSFAIEISDVCYLKALGDTKGFFIIAERLVAKMLITTPFVDLSIREKTAEYYFPDFKSSDEESALISSLIKKAVIKDAKDGERMIDNIFSALESIQYGIFEIASSIDYSTITDEELDKLDMYSIWKKGRA